MIKNPGMKKQVKRMRGRTLFEVYEKRGERRCNVNESSVCTDFD